MLSMSMITQITIDLQHNKHPNITLHKIINKEMWLKLKAEIVVTSLGIDEDIDHCNIDSTKMDGSTETSITYRNEFF